jgi:hypothetical protein
MLEVVMRPPEVFVRSLSHQEAVKLKRMSSRAEHQATRVRAAILLASNVKTPVPQIARMWLTDESHVRKVIHEFNEEGFDSLRPNLISMDLVTSTHFTVKGLKKRAPKRPPEAPPVRPPPAPPTAPASAELGPLRAPNR